MIAPRLDHNINIMERNMTLRYAAVAIALLCAAGCAQDDQPKDHAGELASGQPPLTVWMGPHDTNIPPQCENWHCQCASLHC